MTTIAVVAGGLREPSSSRLLADRLAAAVHSELPAADLPVFELRRYGRAIMDMMLTGVPAAELESVFATIAEADGLIAVTPAFNASFSGLFKSFFDVLPEGSLQDMPVLIGATGGTERHSLVLEHALRPMFSYLHAMVAPTAVYAATDDFGGAGSFALSARIDKAGADFVRLLNSCGARERFVEGADELSEMQRLLGGLGGPAPVSERDL